MTSRGSSCSGTADGFGREAEHADASTKSAGLSLLPAMQTVPADAPVTNGFPYGHLVGHGSGPKRAG